MRRSHVIFIGGYDDHQGKDHGTGEFGKKAWDISQVVELELQAVNKSALVQVNWMTHGVSSEETCCRLCANITASFKDVDSINVIPIDDGGTKKCSENLS